MSDVTGKVESILKFGNGSELGRMKADILRVLTVYRGVSWRSELFIDLRKLLDFLGRPYTVKANVLDEALNSLKSDGIITIEDRTRGIMMQEGTYVDQLIHLNDYVKIRNILYKDPIFNSYMYSRYKMVEDALSRQS
ncbi:hypothetical protein KEJ51_07745 [Candidatus Bathyarchaeota archaeon]|nr:hypothetical protein [Candidatus Bathyarchaeota archaeon]MBS7626906.1 hypothetical protein [Candidatus Bathyarchaeota archaeon]